MMVLARSLNSRHFSTKFSTALGPTAPFSVWLLVPEAMMPVVIEAGAGAEMERGSRAEAKSRDQETHLTIAGMKRALDERHETPTTAKPRKTGEEHMSKISAPLMSDESAKTEETRGPPKAEVKCLLACANFGFWNEAREIESGRRRGPATAARTISRGGCAGGRGTLGDDL
uniref:Uncharacterized protein n=1 Tax=Steinernema glaseri TaxID=37863 RepID=A0A1I7YXE5_9BILA